MNDIAPVLVTAICMYVTYRIFELFVRRKERMAIIEKLSSGMNPQDLRDQLKLPIYKEGSGGSWAIRIGLLLLGIGLGVTIATVVDLCVAMPSAGNEILFREFRRTIDTLYPACAAVFGGLGLVTAYFIEKKNEK